MEVSRSTVEDILEKEYPGAEAKKIEDVSGLAHLTLLIELQNPEENIALNICYHEDLESGFEVDPEILELLKEETTVPGPEVLSADMSKDHVPYKYFITDRIEGYSPSERFKYLPISRRKKITEQAGEFLGRIHSNITFEDFGCLRTEDGDLTLDKKGSWANTLEGIIEKPIQGMKDTPFEDLIPEARKAVEKNIDMVERKRDQPVLLHQDYTPRNILIKEDDITAVLDWEAAVAGDKEHDFVYSEEGFVDRLYKTPKIREEMRTCFRRGYQKFQDLEDGWRNRKKFYDFFYLLRSMWAYPEQEKEMTQSETKEYIKDLRNEFNEKRKRLQET